MIHAQTPRPPYGTAIGSRHGWLALAWTTVVLVAGGLRFGGLGWLRPLSPLEAGHAWPAWLASIGSSLTVETTTVSSPLLYTAQRFLFWLAGGGDGLARAFPALVGTLLPLVAWRARDRWGTPQALALAVLLAVDPWLVALSRRADGAILALGTALALLVELHRAQRPTGGGDAPRPSWLWWGVLVGLFLLSGPLTWLLLPVLALAWLLLPPPPPRDRGSRVGFVTGLGLALGIGGTGLFAHWQELGTVAYAADLAWSMVTGQDVERLGGPYPWSWAAMRALADVLPLWFLGIPALGLALRKPSEPAPPRAALERRWSFLLAGWALWGAVLWLLPGRNPLVLPMLGLPLLLAAAPVWPRLFRFFRDPTGTPDRWLVLGAFTALMVTARFWTASLVGPPGAADGGLETVLLFYALGPLLAGLFWWWLGPRATLQGLAGVALIGLSLWTVSATWSLSFRLDWPQATGLFGMETGAEIRLLQEDVARLSAYRTGDPTQIPVEVSVPPRLRPLLGWYLREMEALRFVQGVDPEQLAATRALVLAAPDTPLALPGGYVGNAYPVIFRWLPTDLPDVRAWVRWLLTRRMAGSPVVEEVVLWAMGQE